ncbi:MAG: cell wall hydrolase [Bacillota bacterium]
MRKTSQIFILTAIFILSMATVAFAAVTHTVKPGESLYLIGLKTGVSSQEIIKANGLKSVTIHPGQKLVIPSKTAKTSSVRYIVKKGDNLTKIAKKYGTTIKAIQTANKLKGSKIYPGHALVIPVKGKITAGTTVSYKAPKTTASSKAPQSSTVSSPASGDSKAVYTAAGIEVASPTASNANPEGRPASGSTTASGSGTANTTAGSSDTSADSTTGSPAAGNAATDSQVSGDTTAEAVPTPDNQAAATNPAASTPDTDTSLASRSGTSSRIPYSQADLDLLAHLIYGEARGESYEGQVAVAAVTINRLLAPGFPKTLKEVIYQPWAYTSINDGQFDLKPDATAYRAALDALNGYDPTNGALYFWNPATSTSKWILTRTVTSKIGDHNFGI